MPNFLRRSLIRVLSICCVLYLMFDIRLEPRGFNRLASVMHSFSVSRKTQRTGPVKHFVFHALHKTASERTRDQLRIYCHRQNLTCLTYCQCGVCNNASACFFKHFKEADQNVEPGSFTVKRMRDGHCCRLYELFVKHGLDGIVDHMPLFLPENRGFLESVIRPDAFRFTILRDPIDQFISYHGQITWWWNINRYTRYKNATLEKVIDSFWLAAVEQSISEIPIEWRELHYQITNSQSRELGWEGGSWNPDSLEPALQYLRRLHFIGFTEDMKQTWTDLRSLLQWPPEYFTSVAFDGISEKEAWSIGITNYVSKKKRNISATQEQQPEKPHISSGARKRKQLSKEQLAKIKTIQFADSVLYNEAKRLMQT